MPFNLVNKIGKLGEDIACRHFIAEKFQIIERNYWKKWGEIDIIAKKLGKTYFIEVKSVKREDLTNISRENTFRPEENMHPQKLKRLSRVIQSYIAEKKIVEDDWQFDLITVYIEEKSKKAKVVRFENIIL